MGKKEENEYFMKDFIEETLRKGEKQIEKELEDYWNLMSVHSKLLDRVTLGRMSKTGYTWEAIEEVLGTVKTGEKS